jgi:hypothetical protein
MVDFLYRVVQRALGRFGILGVDLHLAKTAQSGNGSGIELGLGKE